LKRSLQERICRRCKYLFDEDRFVTVEPPRAGSDFSALAVRERLGRRWWKAFQQSFSGPAAATWDSKSQAVVTWATCLVSLIPGLGHIVSGAWVRGIIFMAAVGALMAACLVLFSSGVGPFLFGMAAAIHAYSIFELTPYRESTELRTRIGVMASLLVGLFAIYWPLLSFLADRLLRPVTLPAGTRWGGLAVPDVGTLLLLALLFVATLILSYVVGRAIHRRRRQQSA